MAVAVTGRPLRPSASLPPRDLRAARSNVLLALDHMGLLADWDESHLVRAGGHSWERRGGAERGGSGRGKAGLGRLADVTGHLSRERGR